MIDIEKIKQLLGDEGMSDEETVELRRACYELASIIVDYWKWKRGEGKE